MRNPDIIKEKTKNFPFCPENKLIDKDKYNDYMNKINPKNYTKPKKLVCDWSHKKNYLVHYRMLKFYVRHGMVVYKILEIISIKQSKLLEKYINFYTQKRNKAKNDFEKDFYKLPKNVFHGETMQKVRIRLRLEFNKKVDYNEIIKQQSKLTFNGVHRSYENCDSYVFKKKEVVMDRPIYLGLAVLELIKLHMYERNNDKLQQCFGQENIRLHYVDTDAFVLSMITKDIITDFKNLEEIFDFSNPDENHELFRNKNKKVIGKLKIETPKKMLD